MPRFTIPRGAKKMGTRVGGGFFGGFANAAGQWVGNQVFPGPNPNPYQYARAAAIIPEDAENPNPTDQPEAQEDLLTQFKHLNLCPAVQLGYLDDIHFAAQKPFELTDDTTQVFHPANFATVSAVHSPTQTSARLTELGFHPVYVHHVVEPWVARRSASADETTSVPSSVFFTVRYVFVRQVMKTGPLESLKPAQEFVDAIRDAVDGDAEGKLLATLQRYGEVLPLYVQLGCAATATVEYPITQSDVKESKELDDSLNWITKTAFEIKTSGTTVSSYGLGEKEEKQVNDALKRLSISTVGGRSFPITNSTDYQKWLESVEEQHSWDIVGLGDVHSTLELLIPKHQHLYKQAIELASKTLPQLKVTGEQGVDGAKVMARPPSKWDFPREPWPLGPIVD